MLEIFLIGLGLVNRLKNIADILWGELDFEKSFGKISFIVPSR